MTRTFVSTIALSALLATASHADTPTRRHDDSPYGRHL
jgi:hypothetical protein